MKPEPPLKPETAVIELIRQEAERKYPRRMKVLARRLQWDAAKLSRILRGEQPARLAELLPLCAALSVPLSQVLRSAGA